MAATRMSFSYPKDMKDKLLMLAKRDSRTLSSYIQKILHNHIHNNTDSTTEKEKVQSSNLKQDEVNPDRLNLQCPGCEAFVPVPTYKGLCDDEDYSVDEAPLPIIAEVNEESRQERVQCQSCGMQIALVVKFIAYEQELAVQRRFNRKWRKE